MKVIWDGRAVAKTRTSSFYRVEIVNILLGLEIIRNIRCFFYNKNEYMDCNKTRISLERTVEIINNTAFIN